MQRPSDDFPLLAARTRSPSLVYLDSAATSQKPRAVLEAMDAFLRTANANVHRGVYRLAEEATRRYHEAREKVRAFLNAPRAYNHDGAPTTIVFTKNATEALNLVAWSYGLQALSPGDEILVTRMEHHSNFVPWQLVAARTGAGLAIVDPEPDGTLSLERFRRSVSERTKIVALCHVSNVLGTVNSVREVADLAHAAGAVVVVDGAQSAPHLPVDVQALGCDFFAASGHKMLGPTGIGILYGREALLSAMPPFLAGGGMIREVRDRSSTWNDLPYKFEAGTPPIAEAVGLAAAVDYLAAFGMDRIRERVSALVSLAWDGLSRIPGVSLHGPPPDRRAGLVSFSLDGVHAHDLAHILDEEGIAIRAGHHCAQPLHAWLGVPATPRASFHIYNDEEDVDRLLAALGKVRDVFHAAR
ncbi:MAG: cysteine desulfurase [Planctomycetes bacterium]|nr:cysteine desulfurase [Planctomycetota bacterium]